MNTSTNTKATSTNQAYINLTNNIKESIRWILREVQEPNLSDSQHNDIWTDRLLTRKLHKDFC
jgi:hypothetical protein